MICWRWLLLLMLGCFAVGLIFGAGYRDEIVAALERFAS